MAYETISDAEYLAHPAMNDVAFELSNTSIQIKSPGTSFVGAVLNDFLDKTALLSSYRAVLAKAKAQKIKISYSRHFKRTIEQRWEEYEASEYERRKLFDQMLQQAKVVERRGIHYGCRDDRELNALTEMSANFRKFGYRNGVISCMNSIHSELEELNRSLSETPEFRYDTIYL